MSPLLALIVNLLVLKIGWLLAVVGAGHGIGWSGPLWSAAVLAAYLWLGALRPGEGRLVLAACLIGLAVDTTVMRLGYIHFAADGPVTGLAPAWILGLWVLLATTLPRSLRWLIGHPVLGFLAGAVLAPLSYWAGAGLGAARFPAGQTQALVAVAVAWAFALPLLAETTRRLLEPGDSVRDADIPTAPGPTPQTRRPSTL